MMYNPFDTATAVNPLQNPSVLTTPIPAARGDQHHFLQHAAASTTTCTNLGPIFDAQLNSNFAYCYDRGNGQYTRLIPADMLPPLQKHSCYAAWLRWYDGGSSAPWFASKRILEQYRACCSTKPPGDTPLASGHNPALLLLSETWGGYRQSTPGFSRIDNIVVTTPSTANLLSPSLSNAATGGHRQSKIYCDKWVHEGVCAFTQRGCKYKHEMPSDKLTQHQLGLFQGYPHWWKKHQADLSRQREALPSETPKNSSQSNEYRGSNERYIGNPIGSAARNTSCRGLSSNTGSQLPWQQNGEYSGKSQLLGANSSVVRTTSRDMSSAIRNVMNVAANIPSRDLSPCPVSYESPFGPIAPPARSNATVVIRTDSRSGAPTGTNRY
ncbi:hypothetical protein NPX13_g7942 [Xylaria arbuscula]|uniref:C3H1-type domain-containing protein n=1 Tax=Xylaria arbuscula TaxID=114810 RepID=A0A9W8N9K5_9PEZI|nr:hypothetical protein NPX13_g7942 [Xylaria arbuscula]